VNRLHADSANADAGGRPHTGPIAALPAAAGSGGTLADRIEAIDWQTVTQELDAHGHAVIRALLPTAECAQIAALYPRESLFRSRVVMARHGFGRGE